VTARRPRTYWVRLLIAFIGIAIGAVMLGAYSLSNQTQATIGKTLFHALSGLAFLYCLFAGRLSTADSISGEKRDGTLGLLFLTDLKGYDIVIGKIVATSLNSFYGLLAILPVLGLPLLLGGMTNGEFARMVLVLVSMFLLSLAIGIFASALSRDARGAYAGNLSLTLAAVAIMPFFVAQVLANLEGTTIQPWHFVTSPAFGLYATDAAVHASEPELYWWSISITQAWAWILIAAASWTVPRTWQDLPAAPTGRRRSWRALWRQLSYGSPGKLKPFRKRLLDLNGFYWLAARARLKPLHVWLLILGAAAWWLTGWALTEGDFWYDPSVGIALAFILNSAIKMWIAIESGQQLAEDRRDGTLELLLSTPLTAGDIVKGQLLALRRQFLGPLLVIIAIKLGFMIVSLRNSYDPATLYLWLAGMVMLLADVAALIFVALAAALTSKSPQHAILKTFFRILVLPWIAFAVISVLANLWVSLGADGGEPLSWRFNLGLWFALGLATDLIFGAHATRILFTRFRQLAAERFDAPAAAKSGRNWSLFRRRPAAEPLTTATAPGESGAAEDLVPPRKRRRPAWAWATALGVIVVGCAFVYRQLNPRPPAPVVVALTGGESLEGLRISTGNTGFLFVMPDDSLWQWGLGRPPRNARAKVPQPLDHAQRWRTAQSGVDAVYGLRDDGTLWGAGLRRDGSLGRWVQIGRANDWAALAIGQGHHAALKQDGTLWMWGDNNFRQLGTTTPTPKQADPIQVGTNSNWTSVHCWARCTIALQADGSLWFWGEPPHVFKNRGRPRIVIPEPTRYSRDDGWSAIASHWTTYARDASGTWRLLLYDLPDPEVTADENSLPFLTQAATDAPAFGLLASPPFGPAAYEVRPDGSLMVTAFSLPFISGPTSTVEDWQPFGDRQDWMRVWSNGGTMLGLTADGTLWTWGVDLSTDGDRTLRARLARLEAKLNSLFGRMPGRRGVAGGQAIQQEPRPLIKFVREPR